MHRVWDTGIIERASRDEARWLDDLIAMDTPEARQKAQGGSVEDWATESLLAAREAYQDPETGNRIKSGAKLGDPYYERNLGREAAVVSGGGEAGVGAQRGVSGGLTGAVDSSDLRSLSKWTKPFSKKS